MSERQKVLEVDREQRQPTQAPADGWKPRKRISRYLNAGTRNPRMQRLGGRFHARVYRLTRGRVMGRWFGGPVLLLETNGRKTGRRRVTPMVYLDQGERLIVMAINAGAPKTPSWWLNLREMGESEVLVRGERRPVRARELEGEERERAWRQYAEMAPAVDDFRVYAKDRHIPVVALEPAEGASS